MSYQVGSGLVFAALMNLFAIPIILFTADAWKGKIIAFLIVTSICFGCGYLMGNDAVQSHEEWNDGICIKCGGEYQFTSATRWRTYQEFYYTCEDCGYTIETDCLYNK